MANERLKPCPFCACEYIEIYKTDKIGLYIAQCMICGAKSGIRENAERAIEAWNRRANNGE